jgi:hypothetical protein
MIPPETVGTADQQPTLASLSATVLQALTTGYPPGDCRLGFF